MVLMKWTDHSRRRFESWRISILQEMVTEYRKSVAPLLLALFIDRCRRHNSHYVACFKGLLHRSIVASFSGGPSPGPTAKAPRAEGRGTRALFRLLRFAASSCGQLARVAVSFLGPALKRKHSSRNPEEKKR